MRPYVQGSLEALTWVQELLEGLRGDPHGVDKAIKEVEDALRDLRRGMALDFRERLRATV